MLKIHSNAARDEKLSTLKPVVVLSRLPNVKPSPLTHYGKGLRRKRPEKPSKTKVPVSKQKPCDKLTVNPVHMTEDLIEKTAKPAFGHLSNKTNELQRTVNSNASGDSHNNSSKLNRKCLQRFHSANVSEDRPFKCAECGECFHTNILLAVHKRIHNQELSSEDDSESDLLKTGTRGEITTNTLQSNRTPVPENNAGQFQTHDKGRISSEDSLLLLDTEKGNLKAQVRQKRSRQSGPVAETDPLAFKDAAIQKKIPSTRSKTKVLSEPLTSETTVVQSDGIQINQDLGVSTPCVPDHDYTYTCLEASLPNDKTASDNHRLRGKRRTLKPVLVKCKECPVSFSQQWYVDLHMILLHYVNDKNTPLCCPQCKQMCMKENQLRNHIWRDHFMDYNIMNNEISSALGMTTDALTGEHVKSLKMKGPHEENGLGKSPMNPSNIAPNISCDWTRTTPSQRDIILDLIEAELRHIITERNKMGDHFCFADLQRLSLQICETLSISHFFDGQPPKRWAQRILTKTRQTPRPGRFRFAHNLNSSYLNTVHELSARGLTESNVFYAFEARLCDVKHNGTVRRVTKTCLGARSPDVTLDDTVCTVLCANAIGSVILQPTMIFRGQIRNIQTLGKVPRSQSHCPSRDLLENEYFKQWFAQFLLSIPPVRPVILLVEGHVSQLSYIIIKMARENDIHIVFVPSRKRFVHSHQLIRESLLSPLLDGFDAEELNFLKKHKLDALLLKDFHQVFRLAWNKTVSKAEIRQSFKQAGFLPLPTSVRPLEEAVRGYLHEVLGVRDRAPGSETSSNPDSPAPVPSPSPSLPLDPLAGCGEDLALALAVPAGAEEIKEEPMDTDSLPDGGDARDAMDAAGCRLAHTPSEVKDEPTREVDEPESGSRPRLRTGIPDVPVLALPLPLLDRVKDEPGDVDVDVEVSPDKQECRGFSSSEALFRHPCQEVLKEEDPEFKTEDSSDPHLLHKCAYCGRGFPVVSLLETHDCPEDEDHSCPICDAQFKDKDELLRHKCNVSRRTPEECDLYTCPSCGMSFALEATLKFHLTTHGNGQRTVPPPWTLLGYDYSSPAARGHAKPSPGDKQPQPRKVAKQVAKKRLHAAVSHSQGARPGEAPAKVRKQVTFSLPEKDDGRPDAGPNSPVSTSSVLSSSSSRTLTASPSDMVWTDDDDRPGLDDGLVEVKEEFDVGPSEAASPRPSPALTPVSCPRPVLDPVSCPPSPRPGLTQAAQAAQAPSASRNPKLMAKRRVALPRPPLPEHDYLGQVYARPLNTGVTVHFSRSGNQLVRTYLGANAKKSATTTRVQGASSQATRPVAGPVLKPTPTSISIPTSPPNLTTIRTPISVLNLKPISRVQGASSQATRPVAGPVLKPTPTSISIPTFPSNLTPIRTPISVLNLKPISIPISAAALPNLKRVKVLTGSQLIQLSGAELLNLGLFTGLHKK